MSDTQLLLGKPMLQDPGMSVLDGSGIMPLLDLDFTQGYPYAHRIGNPGVTGTRASEATRYWLQPADDLANNAIRYARNSEEGRLNGVLIEGADQSLITYNTGVDQQMIDLRWNNRDNGCLRAFFFEDDCDDEMGIANATGTNITYEDNDYGYPFYTELGRCVVCNSTTSIVNAGKAADINNLVEWSIAVLINPASDGEGNAGHICAKGAANLRLNVLDESAGYVKIYSRHQYDGTMATSVSNTRVIPLATWSRLVVTYSESGDRKIHIYLNSVEVTYTTQTASVGAHVDDSGNDLIIGNRSDGARAFDGKLDRFCLWDRALTAAEIAQFSWNGAIANQLLVWTYVPAATPNLYGGHSIYCEEHTGAANQLYQRKTLTAAKYIVSALVRYWDGRPITTALIDAFADTALTNEIGTTHYEHLGGDVYWVWGEFLATAAAWNVGLEIKADIKITISLITCHLSTPTNEGGSFPRSPTPNPTGVARTRAADVLTLAADNNIGLAAGTIDVEFVAPAAENEVGVLGLRIWDIYLDDNNRMGLFYDSAANNQLWVRHSVGGGVVDIKGNVGVSRGDIVKIRVVYGTNVDGAKDLIFYASVNYGGWNEIASGDGPLAGNIPIGCTIYLGSYGGGDFHLSSFIRRFRIYDRAIAGAGW